MDNSTLVTASLLRPGDYAVWGCLLAASALIGIYYALQEYISPEIEDTEDFMLGGRFEN